MTSVLTEDEMIEIGRSGVNRLDTVRRTVSAVVAKLSAGVSVEPVGYLSEHTCDGPFKFQFNKELTGVYTDNAITIDAVYTAAAIAAARVQALEEAAKLVIETKEWRGKGWQGMLCHDTKQAIAIGIRALLGKEATS